MNWRIGLLAFLFWAQPTCAEAPHDVERQRLVAISSSLRCLVCKGEPLYGAQAALAEDLRSEIHGLIEQGKSDQEIVDTLLARYGELLLREGSSGAGWFWSGALATLLMGGAALLYLGRRHGPRAPPREPLSPEHRAHKRFPLRFR